MGTVAALTTLNYYIATLAASEGDVVF